MAADSGDTSWAQGPFGDDAWDVELDEAFVQAAPVKEQSARARSLAAARTRHPAAAAGPAPPVRAPRRRRTLRILAIGLVAAVGIAFGARELALENTLPSGTAAVGGSGPVAVHPPRPAGEPVQGGSATATYPPGTLTAESGVPAASPGLPAGAAGRAVLTPPIAFPEFVRDPADRRLYTRIGYRQAEGCTDPDLVSAALAEQIELRSGCLGLSFALYADGSHNQYTVADLTLTSATDSFALIQWCADNADTDVIGPLLPGPESGLRPLDATSGTAQTFAAAGRVLTLGLAEWSDGHAGDDAGLQKLLRPLFGDLSARAADYEGGNALAPE